MQRQTTERVQRKFNVSQRRACRVLGLRRSSIRYQAPINAYNGQLRKRILELVRLRPRFGYRQIARLLRQEGFRVNDKRIYRLWRQEGLKVPRKTKKRRALGDGSSACHRFKAERPNHIWSWDFIFDRTANGKALKCFTIIDEYTRRCITLKVSRHLRSEEIINHLGELFLIYGMPKYIRSDNGPEFIAIAIKKWLERLEIQPLYVAPGSPWENGYAESFHSRVRDELFNVEEFSNLSQAVACVAAWREDYNDYRPHSSLQGMTPTEFARRCAASVSAAPPLQQHSDPLLTTQSLLS